MLWKKGKREHETGKGGWLISCDLYRDSLNSLYVSVMHRRVGKCWSRTNTGVCLRWSRKFQLQWFLGQYFNICLSATVSSSPAWTTQSDRPYTEQKRRQTKRSGCLFELDRSEDKQDRVRPSTTSLSAHWNASDRYARLTGCKCHGFI